MDQMDVSVMKLGLTLPLRMSQLEEISLYHLLTASNFYAAFCPHCQAAAFSINTTQPSISNIFFKLLPDMPNLDKLL